MKKPVVLIVRGEYLDQATYDRYAGLAKDFTIRFLTTANHLYQIKTIKNVPVIEAKTNLTDAENAARKIPYSKQVLTKLRPKRYVKWGEYVKDVDIVHVEETYNWYSMQAMEEKDTYGYKVVSTVWENIPFVEYYKIKYEIGNILGSRLPFLSHAHNNFDAKGRKLIADKLDVFMATSLRTKEMLTIEGFDPKKVVIIMPPKDGDLFKPQAKNKTLMKKYGIKEGDIVIGSQARLVWEKGLYELVYAAYQLLHDESLSHVSLKFIIVGRGELERSLRSLIKRLNLEDRFILESNLIPHNQMPSYYALMDIFALDSIAVPFWQEQIGQALVEAMLTEVPTIAGQSGSIPEVVGDAAVLVQPADFHDLTEKIKQFLLDPSLRKTYGKSGREHSLKEFNFEAFYKATSDAYMKALEG